MFCELCGGAGHPEAYHVRRPDPQDPSLVYWLGRTWTVEVLDDLDRRHGSDHATRVMPDALVYTVDACRAPFIVVRVLRLGGRRDRLHITVNEDGSVEVREAPEGSSVVAGG